MPYYLDAVVARSFILPALLLATLIGCEGSKRTIGGKEPATRFPSVVRFEASARAVKPGQTVELSWEVLDADSVEIAPDVRPPHPELNGVATTAPLETTTSFTLTARSSVGETTRVVTVTVGSGDQVDIASFTATPTITSPGGEVTLRWVTERSTLVRLEVERGAVIDANAPPRGARIVNPTDSVVYVLTADGPGGPKFERVSIEVGKAPSIVRFGAAPSAISRGQASVLSWEVTGASSVSIAGASGVLHRTAELASSFEVRPELTTEYTLSAANPAGMAIDRVVVRVDDGGQVAVSRFEVSPTELAMPGDVNVVWATMGADRTRLTANGQAVNGFPGTAAGMMTLPIAMTTALLLEATGPTGMDRAMATVTVRTAMDTTPPVITHSPVTASQLAGASVPISALVSDAGGVASVTLFHRPAGVQSFVQVALTESMGAWSGAIPAVRAPGAEYYLEARDMAGNAARSPLTAPQDLHAFSVRVADTTPPVITHTSVADGQVAGASVQISASVVDSGSGVNTVALFHRIEGAAQFSSTPMAPVGGDQYRATLPGAAVQPVAVEYYIAATDGAAPANTATLPASAPAASFRFTVTPQDQAPPTISHTPIPDGQTAGGGILVAAQVSDPSGVGAVSLYYRRVGAPSFTVLSMNLTSGEHRATIPGTAVAPPSVEYYVEARDGAAVPNTGTLPAGAPATSFRFTVVMNDTNPPAIVHNPITGVRAPGSAVMVSADISDASGVASATLSYRRSGETTWQSAAMSGGPTYSASIPASAVIPPAIEYYLQAADGATPSNAGTEPRGAPGSYYTFVVGVSEAEPNNTPATATALLTSGALVNVGVGAVSPATDLDWWYVDVPASAVRYNLSLETTSGGVGSCPAPIDTVLRLYDGDGTTLRVSDSFDGVGNCSKIDPRTDVAAVALAPGRYYVRVEESGNDAVVGLYELRASLDPAACGNRILELAAGEHCDDGNTMSMDGCSSTCRHEPLGIATAPGATFTGDISPIRERDLYAVDVAQGENLVAIVSNGMGGCPGDSLLELLAPDGVTVLGRDDLDGPGDCSQIHALDDAWATNLAAGRYFLRLSEDGDDALIMGYSLEIQIRVAICGNGTVEMGEQCDDRNRASFDGCSATCQWETAGTAMGNGASFAGAISPAGNIDFYAVVVGQGDSIRAETFAPAAGDCATGVDTLIRLYAADRRTELAVDDQDGIRNCSAFDPSRDLEVRNLAAGTYYVAVEEYLNNAELAAYVLDVMIIRPGCGNGWIDGNDRCDDGNTTAGDGCSATCQFEGPGEMEPNDLRPMANPLITGTATIGRIYGALASAADVDVYRIDVSAPRHLFAEVSDGRGGCPNGANLRLRDAAGTSLADDATDGPGDCGRLSPDLDAAVRSLAAGTYYLEVTGSGGSAAYVLDARLLTPGCGDRLLDSGEQCDDGNTQNGDGCSATCRLEGNVEVEPNGTTATATPLLTDPMTTPRASIRGVISDGTDVDVYQVVMRPGYHLLAYVDDGAGRCPNNGALRVRNAAGASLITDTNDGPEECGRISPGLNTTARALAAGTYYVDVTAAAGRTATYTLTVEVLAPTVCANYLLDTGEQCDDGNAASGDGCSASCQLERTEAEANNAFSTANLLPAGAPSTIGASIGTADEDWFRVVVGAGQSLTIVTHGGGIDECGSDSDTVVDLLGPDGSTVLATDDDDGPGVCSTIDRAQAAGLAAGTYYIRVRPYWSNRTFPYVLSIRVE